MAKEEEVNTAMEMEALYDLIGLQTEVRSRLCLACEEVDPGQVEPYLVRMMEQDTAAEAYKELTALLTQDDDNMKMLYCQLECARRQHEKFRQRGITETVYADTMKCFTRFLGECRQKNGRMFFDRGWWTYRQVSMGLFRIGALEYEFREQGEDRTVAVHIPSDADLSPEAVEDSFREAAVFFRTCYPDFGYDRYTCESWLMSPVLKQLLPEKSNIVAFQKRFTIRSVDKEEKEYIEWLFQVPMDTAYDRLPERTTLQRKVKELLLAGGTVGSAYGIIEIP